MVGKLVKRCFEADTRLEAVIDGESCELTDTNWLEVTAMAVVGMPLLGKISRQSM